MLNSPLINAFFNSAQVSEKIQQITQLVNEVLHYGDKIALSEAIPGKPYRELAVCPPQDLPAKPGLSYIEGQARLMHDLASIELQACEVMLRTLMEFPNAPTAFRESLGQLVIEESLHLRLCLECLEDLKHPWGTWPVHISLWEALRPEDSLIDRVVIIHRYLEGSGLDAGEQILKRLNGIHNSQVYRAVNTIFQEELNHVQFGSQWYRSLCINEGKDPHSDFPQRMDRLSKQLPRRLEKINSQLRIAAGFTLDEISYLQKRRLQFLT